MPSCERCWRDTASARWHGDTDAYHRLLEERGPNGCTPEQQAGDDAAECPTCHRMTMHQHVRDVCMAGCPKQEPKAVIQEPDLPVMRAKEV